jgi:N-acyl homoserine lactone hydrolase
MKIHALSTGVVQIKPSQIQAAPGTRFSRLLRTVTQREWTPPLPIFCYAVEHPEGVILVDTGDTHERPAGMAHPFHALAAKISVDSEEQIGSHLARLGISAKDVRLVVLTHLHIDHDGGIASFPDARIIVAKQEFTQARGLIGRLNGYTPQRWSADWQPEFTALEARGYGAFTQHQTLTRAGDVLVVPTPGHTAGHQSVIVRDGDLHYFLAGDVSYTQQGLLEDWIDGVGPSVHQQRDTHDQIQRFAQERPTVYLPTHDPEAKMRLECQITVY